jgi:hypothetical protein
LPEGFEIEAGGDVAGAAAFVPDRTEFARRLMLTTGHGDESPAIGIRNGF